MEKIKSNAVWIVVVAVVLMFAGLVFVGNTTAKADGGTCAFKLGDFCLVDVVKELNELKGALDLEPSFEEEALGAGFSHATDYCIEVGSVERCFASQIMRQATTTICSFRSPSATSTITGGFVTFTTGSTTAYEVSVAKAITRYATTTSLISDVTLAANIQGTIQIDVAVAATLDATQILSPLTFVNVGIQGDLVDGGEESETGYYANAAPVGSCSVEFMKI